jgi:hypothetical protein
VKEVLICDVEKEGRVLIVGMPVPSTIRMAIAKCARIARAIAARIANATSASALRPANKAKSDVGPWLHSSGSRQTPFR